jgi:hypothetical protein
MARKSKSKVKGSRMLTVMHPDAAGIDIGAEEIFVAVAAERAEESVRSFGTFTRDLHEVADWMQSCGVRTVAMESTGRPSNARPAARLRASAFAKPRPGACVQRAFSEQAPQSAAEARYMM